MSTTVQFVFDIPCVWSYFGFTRLRRALARFRADGGQADVVLLPFQLDPDASVEGEPKLQVLRRAFGADAEAAVTRITAMAAEEGLLFRHENAISSNSFEAHRLIAVAARQGLGEEMTERLFRAHHTDELNIADLDTLKTLAEETGVRWSHEGAEETRAALELVRNSGVRGVPVYRFAGRPPLTGAQAEQTLLAALTSAAQEHPHHL
ncbi:DsbA family oxidoreductase [Nonomuraea indica]|uniref:DsbA family oxidoreductase n=1 Tax=Nonomuraea indica TaxID=1581193 RepID=UPI0015DD9322|nr:DsbA family protein [Nonomuraea indica]